MPAEPVSISLSATRTLYLYRQHDRVKAKLQDGNAFTPPIDVTIFGLTSIADHITDRVVFEQDTQTLTIHWDEGWLHLEWQRPSMGIHEVVPVDELNAHSAQSRESTKHPSPYAAAQRSIPRRQLRAILSHESQVVLSSAS